MVKTNFKAKGLVTQGLEYTPDKRGVSSSNLLEPSNSKLIVVNLLCTNFFVGVVELADTLGLGSNSD